MLASVLALLSARGPDSGSSSPAPFAYFDRGSSSWKTSQGSLLQDSDSSYPTWPKRLMTFAGAAFELLMLGRPTAESGSSSLLPTPSANDHTGAEGETRARRQEQGATGGPSLRDLPKLLPTPTAGDHKSTRNETSEARGWERGERHPRTTLTDAAGSLLPTPVANPENPGTGGELRAALTHGPTRRNETGTDSWGRPNVGRSLPPPTTRDHKGRNQRDDDSCLPGALDRISPGATTSTPSGDGSSSPDQPPGHLTIGDA